MENRTRFERERESPTNLDFLAGFFTGWQIAQSQESQEPSPWRPKEQEATSSNKNPTRIIPFLFPLFLIAMASNLVATYLDKQEQCKGTYSFISSSLVKPCSLRNSQARQRQKTKA